MNENLFDARVCGALCFERIGETRHAHGHRRHGRPAGFRLDEPDCAVPGGHEEVHFQPLLVAEEVEFAAAARVDLCLDNLRRDEALEECAEEG